MKAAAAATRRKGKKYQAASRQMNATAMQHQEMRRRRAMFRAVKTSWREMLARSRSREKRSRAAGTAQR